MSPADHVASLLELIQSGRLPHALLIEGGSAESRTQLAVRLAQGLCCPEHGPCLRCLTCRRIAEGIYPDVVLSASDKPLSVDEVRSGLIGGISLRPVEGDCKVYLLDVSRGITPQAQNALLKSLEEPPKNVYIVLLCEDRLSLLETVRSRCASFTADGASLPSDHAEELAQAFFAALTGGDEFENYTFAVKLPGLAKGDLSDTLKALAALFVRELETAVEGNRGSARSRYANCVERCERYIAMLPRNINPESIAAGLAIELWEELH